MIGLSRMWAVLLAVFLPVVLRDVLAEKVSKNPTDTITSAGDSTRNGYMDSHNMDPNVVQSGSFNMIWTKKMMGNWNGFTEQIYAQPLVFTPSGGKQYVYVISQQNYAYILDAITGDIVKYRQLFIPFLVNPDLEGCNDVADCIGSTATGVIDPDTGTWYLTTKTYKDQTRIDPQGLKSGRYWIHALDVVTLESKPNFPIPLEGIVADNAPWRMFEGGKHHQRPALMQVGNHVFAGFASHCVQWNFTGWIIGWHATEGRLVTKYAMEGGHETNGIGGGVWMSGGGLASDNPGRMFFATGNGYASQLADDPVPGRQPPTALEEAVVNMAINEDGSLTPADFFMPWEKRDLDGMDKDLGTSGFILLQPNVFSTDTVKHIGCVTGKTGKLYFLNLDDLGGYKMGANRKDRALQVTDMGGPVFASAATWPFDGGYVYVTPVGHQTVAFKFGKNSDGDPVFSKAGVTTESAAARQGVGHAVVTSLHGQPGSGILWIVDVDGSNLRAYGTVPVNGILPTLALFNNVAQTKFSRPTFGDGKIYLTTHTGYVTAFGSPVNMPLECSSPYDAGMVNIGATSTTAITCKAKIPLTINTIDVDLTTNFAPFDFVVPKAMAIGNTFTLKANFTPKAVGSLSTNINLRTTNGGTQKYAINTPVVIRGVAVSQNPIITIQPNVVSFGEFVVGGDSSGESLEFTIENDGQNPLVITSYQASLNSSTGPFLPGSPKVAGPFTFVDLPAVGSSIPGSSSISTTINFNPATSGYFSAYLIVKTNGGSQTVGAFGTAGSAPKAVLEWQLANGTWVQFRDDVPFAFGLVPLGTQQFRTMRLRNTGGTTLTTTISKPPVSGALAAANALGSIAEGSQIAPGKYADATLICSPPKSQVNEDPTTLTAVWTMNNNDGTFGKHQIQFTCNGASTQVGPLDPDGVAYYRYLGCYKDANPNRNLEELLYYNAKTTNGLCQMDCHALPQLFPFAATEYEGECWCGSKPPQTKVDDTFCQYLCRGNFMEYCGGDGAYMSLFADRRRYTPGNSISSISSSIASWATSGTTISWSTLVPTSTSRPDFKYLGCVNEGINGRALAKDSTTGSILTIESCEDYCTGKGYPLSGMEYATECYCGSQLENGAVISGSTQCNMACGGNTNEICGGSGALSVYNNTALLPQKSPTTVSNVGNYNSQGCYTEGVGERALVGPSTIASNMTVAICVNFCKDLSFKYAGIEFSTECYCGASIATTALKAATLDCNMLCGGDAYTYCGGSGKLNLYAAVASNTVSSSTSRVPLSSVSIISGSSVVVSSSSSIKSVSSSKTSSAITSPTARPNFKYLGCANEGTSGRALSKDSFVNLTVTLEMCQDYCTTKGYHLSGVEYSAECYCGDVLENGSSIGGSTDCVMACGGNTAAICGGPGALSVYNNTALTSPKQPATVPSVDSYFSRGCYKEGINERALAATATSASDMTVAICVGFCEADGYMYAGLEYSTECYCGSAIAKTAARSGDVDCSMPCGGDPSAYCGGPERLNVYAAAASSGTASSSTKSSVTSRSTSIIPTSSVVTRGNITVTSSSTSSSATPTTRPGFKYLGCANEGANGRALNKDAYAISTMTNAICQDYCTAKGYSLSGVEYSTECYCGNILENNSTIGASTACIMPCGGNSNQICGGPSALSVYNNTAIVPLKQPVVVLSVDNYVSQGCYTEGVNDRALSSSITTSATMNVTVCVNYCKTEGFKYAGLEYSTECYCGAVITNMANETSISECNMLCGGDQYAYCGGLGRLNVYAAVSGDTTSKPAGTISSSASTVSGSASATSSAVTVPSSSTVRSTTVTASSTTTSVASSVTKGTTVSSSASSTSPIATVPASGTVRGITVTVSSSTTSSAVASSISSSVSKGATVSSSSSTTGSVSTVPTSSTVRSITVAASLSAAFSATASSTSASPWEYIGCANETDNRSLSGLAASGSMTPQKCQNFCFTNNFPLAGTEYGDQCYCGTALQNGATLNQTGCDMACTGDSSRVCGGVSRLSVYNYTLYIPTIIVPSVGKYLWKGCYTEGSTARTLGEFSFVNSTLTVEQCVTTCQGGTFGLAGMEYGSECYCGNALSRESTKVADTQCDMPCGGNKRTYCGAANRLIVYQMDKSTSPARRS